MSNNIYYLLFFQAKIIFREPIQLDTPTKKFFLETVMVCIKTALCMLPILPHRI